MAKINLGRVKGDPFTFEDFTPEQLDRLQGAPGQEGPPGRDGEPGPIVPISDSVTSPDSGVAASSMAVKTAYDKAVEAREKAAEAEEKAVAAQEKALEIVDGNNPIKSNGILGANELATGFQLADGTDIAALFAAKALEHGPVSTGSSVVVAGSGNAVTDLRVEFEGAPGNQKIRAAISRGNFMTGYCSYCTNCTYCAYCSYCTYCTYVPNPNCACGDS